MKISLSDYFFLLVLASLPIQLGKFFWPDFAYILGLPIDYRAITVYLIDIAVLLYLAVFTIQNRSHLKKIFVNHKSLILYLALFNLYLLITSIFASISTAASLFFNLKIFLFSLFTIAAANTLSSKKMVPWITKVLMFSIIWQSVLIILEFMTQRSIGFWFLGERSFDSSTEGIAHSQVFGRELLRPYGTFSHPNVAGAFFVLTALMITVIAIKNSKLISQKSKIIVGIAALMSIALTFSKTAAATVVFSLLVLAGNVKRTLLILIALVVGIIIFLKILPPSQIPSISERLVLIQSALDMSLKNPLFGIGSNNFILELSKYNLYSLTQIRLLQPVHNVFLLILAQNGIIGLLLFSWLLYAVAKRADTKPKMALFLAILVFASFDHFLWTIEQGQLLLWTSLAFVLA